jgi:hypothetical protein
MGLLPKDFLDQRRLVRTMALHFQGRRIVPEPRHLVCADRTFPSHDDDEIVRLRSATNLL